MAGRNSSHFFMCGGVKNMSVAHDGDLYGRHSCFGTVQVAVWNRHIRGNRSLRQIRDVSCMAFEKGRERKNCGNRAERLRICKKSVEPDTNAAIQPCKRFCCTFRHECPFPGFCDISDDTDRVQCQWLKYRRMRKNTFCRRFWCACEADMTDVVPIMP